MKQIFIILILFTSIQVFGQKIYTRTDSIPITQDSVTILAGPHQGNIQWQESLDNSNWVDIEGKNADSIKVSPMTEAMYRAEITEGTCSPVYSDTAKIVISGFVVMTNGFDPLIATCSTKDGDIDFYGRRDENGVPLKINQIRVKMAEDTITYILDDSGRPTKIFTQNGIQFEFNWISDQNAILSILTNDGKNQINTNVDFSDGSLKSVNIKHITTRLNKSLKLKYTNVEIPKAINTFAEYYGNCTINVTSCGGPSDAEVTVIVKNKSGKTLGSFPAKNIEKGKYVASIPTNLAPKYNPSEICNSVAGVLKIACYINKVPGLPLYLCSAIAVALASTGVAAPVAAIIEESCLTTTSGLNLYCSTLGASLVPDGPSIIKEICNAPTLNRSFSEDIIIYAIANGQPYNSFSKFEPVSGYGPFPNLNIELNSESTIRTLTLDPASPNPGVDYNAICNIFCLRTGTTVKLSILGSDRYSGSVSYTITNTQSEGIFTLTVPGTDSGTHEVITVEVTQPDGTVLTRTFSFSIKALQSDLPILTTTEVTSITQNTAISGGNITSDGGSPITARGVIWSTSPNPTILNVVDNNITSDGTGTGSYISNLTDLIKDTTYYVRAYATNSFGTTYGNEISFRTKTVKDLLTSHNWRFESFSENGVYTFDTCPFVTFGTDGIFTINYVLCSGDGDNLDIQAWNLYNDDQSIQTTSSWTDSSGVHVYVLYFTITELTLSRLEMSGYDDFGGTFVWTFIAL